MKQKTIATRHLRTKIAAGYVLILFVIFGIVYIWLNEQNRQQELEATTYKIRSLRKDVHEVYMKVVDLSMIGETVLDWNEEDMAAYHEKRLEVDSLLSRFKSRTCRSERIDSICQLLAEKEKLLNRIMRVLYEQEEIKEKIARQVPAIALKSSQEEPKKRKRKGLLIANNIPRITPHPPCPSNSVLPHRRIHNPQLPIHHFCLSFTDKHTIFEP